MASTVRINGKLPPESTLRVSSDLSTFSNSFVKRQYAPVEIVQTEKKGFGMRAKKDIVRDQFIYEYIGEVIGEKNFQKRMRDYFDEGIRHFYFMMLQKEQVG